MVVYEDLELNEIENIIGIKPVHKNGLAFEKCNHRTFDNWSEVESFLIQLKKNEKGNFHIFTSVLGYEIYMEHYIRVYYSTHVSNS